MENPVRMMKSMRPMIRIDDLDDPRLNAFRDLRDADLRGARSLFTVESQRVLERFLESGWPVETVLVEEDVQMRLQALLDRLDDAVPVYVTPNGALDAVSGYGFHRGALALGRRNPGAPKQLRLEEVCTRSTCTLLAADGVAHVDNMGSLFRNAACLGASGLLLGPGCTDPLFRKTIRISSGHVFRIPWKVADDFHETLQTLKAIDFKVIGLELSDVSHDIEHMTVAKKTIMIVGSEGDGLSPSTRALCDELVHIPGRGTMDQQESLNVAVASAIGLHELGRRRGR